MSVTTLIRIGVGALVALTLGGCYCYPYGYYYPGGYYGYGAPAGGYYGSYAPGYYWR